jgi:D-alanyl-lipoteichoic acid acyltransferase DltB (MBOAT superfamily)
MFGIRFPLNFNSPYKATSVIDFWARWHMTLTRYITAYLYYPVAMAVTRWRTRHGRATGPAAVASAGGFLSMIVLPTVWAMGLAGIWHGAGLQFLIFGLLHAGYLSINHAWRVFVGGRKPAALRQLRWYQHAGYVLLTFGAVLVAQAFFRADGVHDAWELVQAMFGVRGWESLENLGYLGGMGLGDSWRLLAGHHVQLLYIMVLLAIVWLAPNAQQIMGVYGPSLAKPSPAPRAWMRWQPNWQWLLVMLLMLGLSLLSLHKESRFLYFQF